MDHFTGLNAQERYQNELLNEMRQIRILLERIAQTPEQITEPVKLIKPRGRRKAAGQ